MRFISNQVKVTLGPISVKNVFVFKTTKTPWESGFNVIRIPHPSLSAFIIQKLTIKLLYFQFVALEEMFESCHLLWKGTTALTFKEHKSFLKVGLRLLSYSTALEDRVLSSNMKQQCTFGYHNESFIHHYLVFYLKSEENDEIKDQGRL